MNDFFVEVDDLTHDYGERRAVDHLTFHAHRGEVLALLGPNGAGKTTTIRLVNGLLNAVSGQVRVLGLDPFTQGEAVRRQTGVLTETPALYERLTAHQNLEFFGKLASMPTAGRKSRIAELLNFFELEDRAGDPVSTFSKGMKQRLALARTLLHRPPLLFLDEPTSGLDPEAAQQVHHLIETICREKQQTVLLCTHNLHEAERLSDRVVIINHGRLLASGTLEELRQQVMPGLWLQVDLCAPLPLETLRSLEKRAGVLRVIYSSERSLRILLEEEAVIPDLIADLVQRGSRLLAVQPQRISLEEIYFSLQHASKGGSK